MNILGRILILLFGALLVYASADFPRWGDPAAPASRYVSPHYIERSLAETSVPNIVTAVLADYRGYDTMFETIVIFTAGVACLLLLRVFKRITPPSRMYRHLPTGITLRISRGGAIPESSQEFERIDTQWVPYDLVVKTTCRLIVPFCQLFALYVIAHGHHSPGGGFQGGVILGASIILYAIANTMRASLARVSEKLAVLLCGLGVSVYAATGALAFFMGGNFLDYGRLASLFGTGVVAARSLGILLVEVGVGITVMAVMVHLYYGLASAGRLDEGL